MFNFNKNIVRKTLTMLMQNYDYLNNHSFISSLKRFIRIEKTATKIATNSIMASIGIESPYRPLQQKKLQPLKRPKLLIPPMEFCITKRDNSLVMNIVASNIKYLLKKEENNA